MVIKLDAHQTSLEAFGIPWTSCHAHHPDDEQSLVNSNKPRYFRISASAPPSPPDVYQVLKAGNGCNSGSSDGSNSGRNHVGCRIAGSRSRLAKIQIELQPCQLPTSTPTSPSATATAPADCRPKPKKANSAPVVLQSQSQPSIDSEEREERGGSNPSSPTRVDGSPFTRSLRTATPDARPRVEGAKVTPTFYFPREAFATPSALALRPAKRGRASTDVDGPGTGELSCKKRRLRLHLVTSRLSQPYSWPATHILNRESGDDTPVLSRFLKFAAVGALKRAGRQSALVRKAAILNRVRIGVRHAAVLRGHTVIAGMAARGNLLSHGLQLVTTSNSSTGARFPGLAPNPYDHPIPPAWRPHTTAFHPSPPNLTSTDQSDSASSSENTTPSPTTTPPLPSSARSNVLGRPPYLPLQADDEEDEVSFPSPDLETRYADLSDDDMDDVYADFGVLFGSGARSPEGSGGSDEASSGEHFYEEYLDELDGIRWIA
ncbi:uncharacterized protein GGS22DRAFT_112177 [Annulohypoxylon maeteangense]|uniref:uncharacterized protein n=1 Tax=Annulohypoxylon maeteangense TaxID=1927788 RepID=UPI002007AB65|nr:uncharacterized protein GGS22DRAFT_112177 [Annulohypoxylon maeteangense]KAI0887636.1 hypothetical protein GGS22DRAFT_112177 [Annulohypoxylon maeteangense]